MLFLGCLNPLKVVNASGIHYVGCNSCPACLAMRNNRNASLGYLDALNTHNFFVTLTYDRDNLPVCSVEVTDAETTHTSLAYTSLYKAIWCDYDGEILATSFLNKNQYAQLQRISRYYKSRYALGFNGASFVVPVLLFEQLSLYVKRVRKALAKLGFRVRVQYCGEYGPRTSRPHFHILFQLDGHFEASVLRQVCTSRWEYGNVFCESSNNSVTSYLSNYITSDSNVSSLYACTPFRPRFRHSNHFGFGFLSDEQENFQAYISEQILNGQLPSQQRTSASGNVSVVEYTAYQATRSFLPLPTGLRLEPDSECFQFFHTASVLFRSYLQTYTLMQIARLYYSPECPQVFNVLSKWFGHSEPEHYGNEYLIQKAYRMLLAARCYYNVLNYYGTTFVADSVYTRCYTIAADELIRSRLDSLASEGLPLQEHLSYLHTEKTFLDLPRFDPLYSSYKDHIALVVSNMDKSKKINDSIFQAL